MKYSFLVLLFLITSLFFSKQALAQQPTPSSAVTKNEYLKAQIIQSLGEKANPYSIYNQVFHHYRLEILEGAERGTFVEATYDSKHIDSLQLQPGDTVILEKRFNLQTDTQYTVFDRYRLMNSTVMIVIFLILIVIAAGWKGLGSIIGLVISLGVLFLFIIPQILAGQNPLLIIFIGSIFILFLTTYIAHGFSKQTTIALFSTFIALFITLILSLLTANISQITGYGDESAFLLHFGSKQLIDVRGLLLGGIVLGSLGALNDVTTTQATTMFELHKGSGNKTFSSLLKQGFTIGREHVVSIINTLVLAYAGSSLILFIFIFSNSAYYPTWVILNSELLNEELIRTISGTIGIILVVPIVTILTAFYLVKHNKEH